MRFSVVLIATFVAVAAIACGGDDGSTGRSSCGSDADCNSGDVCARDEACWPASDVHTVKVTWTIDGSAATADTCVNFPDFFVAFESESYGFEFTPVPCVQGEFPIDKLPLPYTQCEVGDLQERYFDQTATIDSFDPATVTFDLVPAGSPTP